MVVGTLKTSLDQHLLSGHVAVSSACGSKFVSRSSRKATGAESVFVG